MVSRPSVKASKVRLVKIDQGIEVRSGYSKDTTAFVFDSLSDLIHERYTSRNARAFRVSYISLTDKYPEIDYIKMATLIIYKDNLRVVKTLRRK